MEPRSLRIGLRIWVGLVLAFLFVPIVLIVLYAFNSSNIESWPISSFSLHWFSVAWHDGQVRSAFPLSVRVGLIATALALVLGSAVAYALHKFSFFGRDGISFLLVLPLALPGIITGIALNSSFTFTAGAQNTLPLWIFGAIRLGQQLPEVNAVVSIVILLTIIPVMLAARLAGAGSVARSGTAAAAATAVGAGGSHTRRAATCSPGRTRRSHFAAGPAAVRSGVTRE
jgi:ABC-type spermidine/putrescine transport system permease subunit II